jgi:hypothetical protein
MKRLRTIVEFTEDQLRLSLSVAQRTLLKSVYGEPLTPEENEIYEACTEKKYDQRPRFDITEIAGARSGKDSRCAAPVAIYEAFRRDHSAYLAPGERGMIAIVAQDSNAGKICFGYIRAAIEGCPALASHITEIRKTEIELSNQIVISVYPCTMRSPRGATCVCAIADEVSFWRDDQSANPDREIIIALKRGQATVPEARLIKISTPYMRAGVLWDDYQKRHQFQDTLVWTAPTWVMNPSIPQSFYDREREKDPIAFAREYGAEFSEDLQAFLPFETVENSVRDYLELPPDPTRFKYYASCDPSAGGQDPFSYGIGHRDGERLVIDLVRGRRAVNPEELVEEICAVLRMFHCSTIVGDRFSGQWVRQSFARRGVSYVVADRTRSEFYVEMLGPLNQERCDLPRNPTLIRELKGLERRTTKAGKDEVNHGPNSNQHDDFANACAILLVTMARPAKRLARAW